MNHRFGRTFFGLAVGVAMAVIAFQWVTDPQPGIERAQEEEVVRASRLLLQTVVMVAGLEIVDPLAPNRKVGKVYVYAEPPGWAVSGYYRRGEEDRWHPYLITLSEDLELYRLKVQDSGLATRALEDARLEVTP